jgi:hypothetical protein
MTFIATCVTTCYLVTNLNGFMNPIGSKVLTYPLRAFRNLLIY